MSLYRVHFKWKNKDIELTAKSLDLTHPYFVSIKDLVFAKDNKIIINPSEEDINKAFGNSKHLMIPFQTVSLIEELSEDSLDAKVRPFTLMDPRRKDEDKEEPAEEDRQPDGHRSDTTP